MKKVRRSKLFTGIGLLLIGAALLLTLYNIAEGVIAGRKADMALDLLRKDMAVSDDSLDDLTSDGRPLYEKYPEMAMPLVEIDGEFYVGVIEIPSLDIELPVKEDFSYKELKSSPCRYDGSVYLDNMIIAAHNYSSHFGKLKNLNIGDRVSFTDGDGNLFLYDVAEIIQVNGNDVEGMKEGDWDMTLFTCTLDGENRVTVRLVKEDGVF